MKIFLIKVSLLILFIIGVVAIGLFLPANKSEKFSFLFAQVDKDKLLKNTPGPRIVLLGGSNLSFGINSQMIKDSLHLNPINTGVFGGFGLNNMMKHTLPYIRANDIVVVAPEYHQFYGSFCDGETELLAMVFDIAPDTKNLVTWRQYLKLTKYVPRFVASKLNPINYLSKLDTTMVNVYERKAFNQYGDVSLHWTLPKEQVLPFGIDGDLNKSCLAALNDFRNELRQKKATLYIAFPGFQDLSYVMAADKIHVINQLLKKNSYIILGTPERYKFPDSLIFNTPYHLTKHGVDLRTQRLIEDIKSVK